MASSQGPCLSNLDLYYISSVTYMPSLKHYSSLVSVLDRQLHHLSTISSSSSSPSASKMMKICKAPELLKKAATMCKSKACALRARLLFLASLRRRMVMVGAISHKIHALMAADREKSSAAEAASRLEYNLHDGDKALVGIMRRREKKAAAVHGEMVISQLSLFDQEDDHHGGGYPDWTHSLFNDDVVVDDDVNGDGDGDDDDDVMLAAFDDDEPSIMEIIRSNREDEGVEFNMDDEIDQAADMFIRRFRKRMSQRI